METETEHRPYLKLKDMIEYGGRKHKMEALTYGYQDIIDDLNSDDDKEVVQFAKHLDNHPELQVERQHAMHRKAQKDVQSYATLRWLFLGVALMMYIATIVLFFLPYLIHANHGLYYFLGAFGTLLIGGALIGCHFMITRPRLRYAQSQYQKCQSHLDYAQRFQNKMQAWIEEGRYE